MRSVAHWLVAGVVLLLGRVGRVERERPRIVAPAAPAPRAEVVVAGLLLLAAASAVAFVVFYAVDALADTQLLGLALGLSFAFVAAAFVVTAHTVVPHEEVDARYEESADEHAGEEISQIVDESRQTFTRRRLLTISAAAAGTALGGALLTPALSLGPGLATEVLRRTPWRPGVRLVDADGRPLVADDLSVDSFRTAYPEGASHETLGAPVVVVRLEPERIDLPPDRDGWAPDGIVAYSKICTHAGCAVSLYRTPLFEPTSPRPALICPCHYSTFDPAAGGDVLYGPAGRPLPQLPLSVGTDGALVARGGFSGAVGPSWWGVRRERS